MSAQTIATSQSRSKGPRSTSTRRRDTLAGFLFLGPAVLLFLTFVLGPFIVGIGLSLFRWDMLTPPEFIGLGNLVALASDPSFYSALRNTFVFSLASMITHLVAGFALAVGVNALRSTVASYFVRTSLFFPFVISWAAVALLWKYVLDPTFGMGTYYLELLGISPPNWFTDPTWALPAIIGIDWWHTVGFTFVIMLAGLQTVPGQLHEAARIDGANAWQRMWHVTIPMMSPTIFFASVITFIGAFQIFDPIQIITPSGGPDESTLSIVMYLYQQGFQAFQAGYASAVALVVFVIMALVTALQFWVSRKWVHNQ
ncbi:carbohydrate ABC transporter permease [Brachybacterium sp. FME24]|uniref:carbohydrate ABC transporter permease n=1 Tax=Brachybacterium sp. FME24 TaxID=2742605 RepID=UPI0018683C66|nr:sugar ABC transporter permease [Brachybacterium sp. FME24]